MKKLTLLAVALCILFTGCFEFLTEDSLIGNWTITGYTDYIDWGDTSFVMSYVYDPEVDQYYSAVIYSITDSLIIAYDNGWESTYSDTLYTFTYSEDTLYLSGMSYLDPDSVEVDYYFMDSKHLIWTISYASTFTEEIHFEKYNGELPPDTWLSEIEDDEYEPDGDIEHASSIRLNTKQSHTLTENDSDYYKIQAKTGKSYLIQGLAYVNMEMYLFDQEGDSLAYDYHNDLWIKDLGDVVRSVILWTCNETGDYYPMISQRNRYSLGGDGAYYQMLVTEVDTNDIEYGEPEGWYLGARHDKGIGIFKNKMNK